MKKKFLSSVIALAVVLNVASVASAAEVNHSNNEGKEVTAVEAVDYDENTLEQLTYATEEMRSAVDLLDNGSMDYERIMTFSATAIERLRSLNVDEIAKIPNGYESYEWVLTTYTRVFNGAEEIKETTRQELSMAIEEMRIAIQELDNGSTNHKRILTFAATALERVRPLVINSGSEFYANYRWVVESYDEVVRTINEIKEGSEKEVEADYDEYTLEQLTIAVEEMRIAVTELDNGSENTDRILTFAATALERVRPLNEDEIKKIENGYGNYRWVVESYDQVVRAILK